VGHLSSHIGNSRGPRLEERLAAAAARRHGVLSEEELQCLGVSANAAYKRAAAGRLHLVFPSAFAVVPKPLLTQHGLWRAALIAGGPNAWLSHTSAAALTDIREDESRIVHITMLRGTSALRSRSDLVVHRVRALHPHDTTHRNGLRTLSWTRALVDLSEMQVSLTPVFVNLEQRGMLEAAPIAAAMERANGRRGVKRLTDELRAYDPVLVGEYSPLPALAMKLLEQAGLPLPDREVNFLDGYSGDLVYTELGIVIELDGFGPHGTRKAMRHDRRRDRRTLLNDMWPLRFTSADLRDDPEGFVADVASAIAKRRAMRAA